MLSNFWKSPWSVRILNSSQHTVSNGIWSRHSQYFWRDICVQQKISIFCLFFEERKQIIIMPKSSLVYLLCLAWWAMISLHIYCTPTSKLILSLAFKITQRKYDSIKLKNLVENHENELLSKKLTMIVRAIQKFELEHADIILVLC